MALPFLVCATCMDYHGPLRPRYTWRRAFLLMITTWDSRVSQGCSQKALAVERFFKHPFLLMYPNSSFGFSYLTTWGFSSWVPHTLQYGKLLTPTISELCLRFRLFIFSEVYLSIHCRDKDNTDNPNWQENDILGQHCWALHVPRKWMTSGQ